MNEVFWSKLKDIENGNMIRLISIFWEKLWFIFQWHFSFRPVTGFLDNSFNSCEKFHYSSWMVCAENIYANNWNWNNKWCMHERFAKRPTENSIIFFVRHIRNFKSFSLCFFCSFLFIAFCILYCVKAVLSKLWWATKIAL